jgi:hypothetical protein
MKIGDIVLYNGERVKIVGRCYGSFDIVPRAVIFYDGHAIVVEMSCLRRIEENAQDSR